MPSPVYRQSEAVRLIQPEINDVHGDPYAEELGAGVAVYDEWAMEEDVPSSSLGRVTSPSHLSGGSSSSRKEPTEMGEWENPQKPHSASCNGRQQHSQSSTRTFHTPSGRPSSNELWRFRSRGCQDCWAALFFIALVVVVLLWGAAQVWQLELTDTDLRIIAGEVEMSSDAEMGQAANVPRSRSPRQMRRPVRHVAALRAGVAALWERQSAILQHTSDAADGGSNDGEERVPPAARTPYRITLGSVLWWLIWVSFGVTTTLVVAYGGLLVISLFPRQLIFLQATMCSMFFAVSAGVSLAQGSPMSALVSALFTFMPLLWVFLIQDRIQFTATMLCATVAVLRRHKSLFMVAFSSVVVSWFVLVLFLLCVLPSCLRLTAGVAAGKDAVYPLMVVFAFFWVQEVLSAVVHVTVCGVVATWYFAGEVYMPAYPVKMSFQRAVTTSFGSVCLGSLVTAVVSFIHFIIDCVRSGNDDNSFVMCLMDCLVSCIEDLVRYFNEYAFVHVAVYGCSYVEAARETWTLVKQCVFSAVFNDCLVSQVISVMTLMSAVSVATIVGLVTWSLAVAAAMFVMTFFVCSIFYSPVASCVTTIFVCFAEVPVGLQLSFPELYDALVDADAGYTQRRGESNALYGTVVV